MSAQHTVDDLIAEVRSLIDESNEESIDDDRDILPALNRAQAYAYNILARRYEDPILVYQDLDLVSGTQEYDIPEDAFEDRVLKVEIKTTQGYYLECQRISFKDISYYETTAQVPQPYYYCIYSRKMRFLPSPSGTYSARIWYIRDPEKLVKPQGRITLVSNLSGYILVDSVGSLITTEVDDLFSYVNVVDGQTGEIKGTLQVQSFTTDKVTFKSTPSRTTVLNRTVTGDLADVAVTSDDYICPIFGTCVAYFQDAISNFILQYAVFQLQSKLGVASMNEVQLVEKFEKQLERQWTNREQTVRIKKTNRIWEFPYKRWRTRF